jgi:hypothetical protein
MLVPPSCDQKPVSFFGDGHGMRRHFTKHFAPVLVHASMVMDWADHHQYVASVRAVVLRSKPVAQDVQHGKIARLRDERHIGNVQPRQVFAIHRIGFL